MSGELNNIPYDTLFTSHGDEDLLGIGGFSTVYRCFSDAHGDLAIKMMSGSGRANEFDEEGKLHLKASVYEYILSVIGITQKIGFLGLVLEYMPYGSLADLIKKRSIEIPWTFRLRAMQETASALAFLHNYSEQKRVLHGDIKAENILLSQDLHVKVSDFGGAKLANHGSMSVERSNRSKQSEATEPNNKAHYTLSHAAPEILKVLDADRTSKMDVYSFAVVLYTVTSRMRPFPDIPIILIPSQVQEGQRPKKGLDKIRQELRQGQNQCSREICDLFCDLMNHCWNAQAKERPSMIQVRERLSSKLTEIPKHDVDKEILELKKKMEPPKVCGKPHNAVNVYAKYMQLQKEASCSQTVQRNPVPTHLQHRIQQNFDRISDVRVPAIPPDPVDTSSPRIQQIQPQNPAQQVKSPPTKTGPIAGASHARKTPLSIYEPPVSSSHPPLHEKSTQHAADLRKQATATESCRPKSHGHTAPSADNYRNREILQELERSFEDPYFRTGNSVRMISDIAAIQNAQVGHGGWNYLLLTLQDVQGHVLKIESNGDVMVSFSGIRSHRFNPSSLVKIPGGNSLSVGDVVKIELDRNLVKIMQEDHGGWVDTMESFFGQQGLVFRFLPDKDVLVVYKNGLHFRYNPEVLCKASEIEDLREICLPDNPDIRIGDYVCHDLDDDVMKGMQETCGGWNEIMSDLRGRVGKFIYADYLGRAFIAYDCKTCFVFNPAVITKLTDEEAHQRFMEHRNRSKLMLKDRTAKQIQERGNVRLKVDDVVRVHLPLDITIELQKGHGGWSYQMLEVYGLQGIIKGFDNNNNAQVLFDSGNKWTFNPGVLECVPDDGSPPAYKPPFRIGDRVRVNFTELPNEVRNDTNKVVQLFRLLGLPEDKVEVLTKTGVVMGIDDDIDVVVCYDNDDKKKYGVKPSLLEKI